MFWRFSLLLCKIVQVVATCKKSVMWLAYQMFPMFPPKLFQACWKCLLHHWCVQRYYIVCSEAMLNDFLSTQLQQHICKTLNSSSACDQWFPLERTISCNQNSITGILETMDFIFFYNQFDFNVENLWKFGSLDQICPNGNATITESPSILTWNGPFFISIFLHIT